MPLALLRHHVDDYDAWRTHFDRRENARQAHGIRNPRVYRNTDDPSDLMLFFDVAAESRVHTAPSADLRVIMQEAGVDLITVVGFMPD